MSLKERLTTVPVLIVPDPSKSYEVFCDTSKKGVDYASEAVDEILE